MRQPCLLACLVSFLLLSAGSAQGQTFPRRDTAWELEERELTTTFGWNEFSFRSQRNTTMGQDEWSLHFDARDALLRFEVNASRPAAAASLDVRLRSLIEFQDHDEDGRLGLGDPVVQQLLFSDGASGWVESVRRADGRMEPVAHYWLKGARVDVAFHASRDGTIGGGGSPTAAPFDVRVSSFPYLTDNRTHLALELRVEGPAAVAGDALASPDGVLRSYLGWQEPLDAAGNATAFGITLQRYLGDPAPQWLVVLSQPRESAAAMHLVVGVARVPPADTIPQILRQISGDWRLYVVGALVAGLAVGWPLYRRAQTNGGHP